ncbi:MAG: winged helix-turn-helix domain-containing protein [Candidatus Thermoplasmatota archaeon]|nr:winged helix-turn-helix domain-containing protein [Candidatus Thermoplasmatota archaeon]
MVIVMFREIFGGSPQAKILDFLGDHPNYDYSISDIAEYAEISRPTLYKIIPGLIGKKILVETRIIGKSKMFKLNTKNELVRKILKFDFELADTMAKMEKETIFA